MYHMVHIRRIALVAAVLAGLVAPAGRSADAASRPTLRSGGTVRWSGGPLAGTAMDRFVGTGQSVCEEASSCERFDLDVRVKPVHGPSGVFIP